MAEGSDSPKDQSIVIPEGRSLSRADIERQVNKPASEFSRKIESAPTNPKDKTPNQLTFEETTKEKQRLERIQTERPGDFTSEDQERLNETMLQGGRLKQEAEQKGLLSGVYDRTENAHSRLLDLQQHADLGNLTSEQRTQFVGFVSDQIEQQKDKSDIEDPRLRGADAQEVVTQLRSYRNIAMQMEAKAAVAGAGGIGGSNKLMEALIQKVDRVGDETEKARLEEHEYRRLLMQGYDFFVDGEERRLFIHPDTFAQQAPLWYRRLGKKEQSAVDARLNINFLAANLRYNGMTNLEGCLVTQAEMRKENLSDLFENMPGFTESLGTMMHDFFEIRDGHLVITGEAAKKRKDGDVYQEDATEGYQYLQKTEWQRNYNEELRLKIAQHLDSQENFAEIASKWGYRSGSKEELAQALDDLATAAVSAADNMLYGFGVYDSADEKYALVNDRAYSEQIRAMFQPGKKGQVRKWLKGEGEERVEMPEGTEEGWGGPLGEWIRDRSINDVNFRMDLDAGEIQLIPDRMLYSLLDHTPMSKRSGGGSFAERIVDAVEEDGAIKGLYFLKLKQGSEDGLLDTLDVREVGKDDLYGVYADTRDSVVKVYKQITGADKPLSRNTLIDALIKARKDDLLKEKYFNEDLVEACIIMGVSPEGLVEGTTDKILQLGKDYGRYDQIVTDYLADERLYHGMPPGYHSRLMRDLGAHDTDTLSGAGATILDDTLIGRLFGLNRKGKIHGARVAKRRAIMSYDQRREFRRAEQEDLEEDDEESQN